MAYAICHDGKLEGDNAFDPLMLIPVADEFLDSCLSINEVGTVEALGNVWLETMVRSYECEMSDFNTMSADDLEGYGLTDLMDESKQIKGVWIVDDKTVDLMKYVAKAIDPGNDSAVYACQRALKAIAQHTSIRNIGEMAE